MGGRSPGDGRVEDADERVRVVLADEGEVFRFGLRTVLRSGGDLVVVAEAAEAEAALAACAETAPDVVLVSHDLPGAEVGAVVGDLAALGVAVLVLGSVGPGGDLVETLRRGASGYVLKDVRPERLVEAVRAVARGETVLDAAATGSLLHQLDDPEPRQEAQDALTPRQQAVAALVAEGLTNSEIADQLRVSRATVKGHITVALRRLGLRDRTQLAIHVNRSRRDGEPPRLGSVTG
ncbi:LuxR C-terminal-related transcriptional regulator [Geodermatophilus marinus]|uniref:LuxR C-terminal-related transcriptional regulator n=1 Tax=Geodermatophilus sp. LHW52908 TaxID=2303986 RepID=UPI000E3C6194|nr:response regulator transcription factor [Geodermatophilus sp. LHW52908]RFU22840.1 DNA-binding response regulator [Geodermatophilus sp. LHW52908]